MVKPFFKPGDLCGSYKIVRLIGQGAFGQVYEAKRLGTTTRMALKCIGLGGLEGDLMKRLVLETEALQTLDHPNIVCMEEAGLNDGVFWIALNYIEGQTLHELIRRGPLTIVKALGIAGQIADGVGAAHARGVIHRDLKPQNMMITPEGGVKILDFGAAKILGEELTAQGGIAPASPLYMAPEQIQGRAVDGRTDIYALGIILHQMLAGKHPYASASGRYPPLTAIAALHLHSSLDRIKGVPEFVFDIIAKATACDPAERFQSMEEVTDAIRASLRRVMDDPAMVWAHASSSGPSSGVPGARVIELFPDRAKPRLHVPRPLATAKPDTSPTPQPLPPAKPDTSPATLRIVAEAEHDNVATSNSDVLATQKWVPALVVSRPDVPGDNPRPLHSAEPPPSLHSAEPPPSLHSAEPPRRQWGRWRRFVAASPLAAAAMLLLFARGWERPHLASPVPVLAMVVPVEVAQILPPPPTQALPEPPPLPPRPRSKAPPREVARTPEKPAVPKGCGDIYYCNEPEVLQ